MFKYWHCHGFGEMWHFREIGVKETKDLYSHFMSSIQTLFYLNHCNQAILQSMPFVLHACNDTTGRLQLRWYVASSSTDNDEYFQDGRKVNLINGMFSNEDIQCQYQQ